MLGWLVSFLSTHLGDEGAGAALGAGGRGDAGAARGQPGSGNLFLYLTQFISSPPKWFFSLAVVRAPTREWRSRCSWVLEWVLGWLLVSQPAVPMTSGRAPFLPNPAFHFRILLREQALEILQPAANGATQNTA